MNNRKKASILPLCLCAIFVVFVTFAHADTFTVLNTGDPGADTLRAAIAGINGTGSGTIQFAAGAEGTIALGSDLDTLNFETIFDTSDYDITLTGHNGGTSADKWFKFDGAGTGTFTFGTGTTWAIGGGLVVGNDDNGSMTISGGGVVSDTWGNIGGFAGGDGTVTVTGAGSTWTNTEGLIVGKVSTGELIIADGGSVSVVGGAGTTTIAADGGSTGTLTIGAGGAAGTINTAIINGGGGTATLKFNHTDAAYTFSPQLAGSLIVEHNGTGTTTLSGVNTYTGKTTIAGGTVKISADSGLGTAPGAATAGHLTFSGGGILETTADMTLSSNRGIAMTGGGSISTDTGTTLTYGGIMAGAGSLTKTGDGTLYLTGDNTGYTMEKVITGGTLKIGNAKALGSAGNAEYVNGGTLDLNGYTISTVNEVLGIGGTGYNNTGALRNSTGDAGWTTAHNIYLLDDARINCDSGATLTISGTNQLQLLTYDLTVGGEGDTTISRVITSTDATGTLIKDGGGTLTLSGNNTFSGTTTVNAGTLKLGHDSALGDQTSGTTVNSGGSLDLNGRDLFTAGEDEPLSIAGTGTAGEGALFNSFAGMSTYSGSITLTAASTIGVTDAAGSMLIYRNINTGAAGYDVTFDGDGDFLVMNTFTGKITGNGDVIKNGAGELLFYMTGSDYAGATTVNEGRLTVGASGVIPDDSALSIALGAELNLNGKNETIGSLSGAGNVINGGAACILASGGNDGSTTFSGIISDGAGATSFTKEGTGTLLFSGANTYTGGTTINSGTLQVSNASAVGTGVVTNNATLDIGSTTLAFDGVYTQAAGSTLRLNAASVSSFGNIVSASDAVVSAASAVNVNVTEYLPNNATLKIIDGTGGAGVNVPSTITSSNSRYTLVGSSVGGDLVLTVNRSGPGQGFAGDAANSNEAAVGAVLDNISNPSGDMADVLNALEGLSSQEVGSSLDTLIPVVDSGVVASSNLSLGQFIGTVTDRLTGLYARLHGSAGGETGVSAGGEGLQGFEAWGQGFGQYLRQDPRGLSNGYRASVWGTAIGGDIPAFNNRVRMGLSGGYAESNINSKDNSGKTDIDSYQGTLYAGYADVENPYYINGAFSFAYNKYDGLRHIAVGTIMRTANSDYDGQQYSVLVDGGYTFKSGEFGVTPMASLQYQRLHLEGYTEKNADALNLHVNSQNYDLLQSGLGMKLERPFKTDTGTIIPEIHARWLYDFIGDRQETTSTFSGGGGSFATNGFDPAQNSLNAGAKITLMANNNWVLETNYDFEYKEDFTAHTGWADVRYRF